MNENFTETPEDMARRFAQEIVDRQHELDQLTQAYEALKAANQAMDARSLRRIQLQVGAWRQAAYPDTATLELQTLGVSEETGELAHAVLKYKQGIRGYDLEKTKTEAADAIGDIMIYAMGVADCLGINVEEALYATAQHVINRNITQDSDSGNDVLIGHTDAHGRPNGTENIPPYLKKGDRVKIIGGEHFLGQFGTVHPAPGVDPHHLRGYLMVMIDGKDSPWSFDPTDLHKIDEVAEEFANEPIGEIVKHTNEPCDSKPKGVDYAGHVPGRPPRRGSDEQRRLYESKPLPAHEAGLCDGSDCPQ